MRAPRRACLFRALLSGVPGSRAFVGVLLPAGCSALPGLSQWLLEPSTEGPALPRCGRVT